MFTMVQAAEAFPIREPIKEFIKYLELILLETVRDFYSREACLNHYSTLETFVLSTINVC